MAVSQQAHKDSVTSVELQDGNVSSVVDVVRALCVIVARLDYDLAVFDQTQPGFDVFSGLIEEGK